MNMKVDKSWFKCFHQAVLSTWVHHLYVTVLNMHYVTNIKQNIENITEFGALIASIVLNLYFYQIQYIQGKINWNLFQKNLTAYTGCNNSTLRLSRLHELSMLHEQLLHAACYNLSKKHCFPCLSICNTSKPQSYFNMLNMLKPQSFDFDFENEIKIIVIN